MTEEATVWSFGYGSNMNLDHLARKKGVKVLEHVPAVMKGFTLGFVRSWALVEPGYAAFRKHDGGEIHGLAFRVSQQDMDEINR